MAVFELVFDLFDRVMQGRIKEYSIEFQEGELKVLYFHPFFFFLIACVASVSVGFSARSRHFLLLGGAKIGASAKNGRRGEGRGGEKRKRLPANPMILKNAHLTLSQLDTFIA